MNASNTRPACFVCPVLLDRAARLSMRFVPTTGIPHDGSAPFRRACSPFLLAVPVGLDSWQVDAHHRCSLCALLTESAAAYAAITCGRSGCSPHFLRSTLQL